MATTTHSMRLPRTRRTYATSFLGWNCCLSATTPGRIVVGVVVHDIVIHIIIRDIVVGVVVARVIVRIVVNGVIVRVIIVAASCGGGRCGGRDGGRRRC